MILGDVTLADIYLGTTASWLGHVPNSNHPLPAPVELTDELQALRGECEAIAEKCVGKNEFAVRSKTGITYRASILQARNETVFVLRKAPDRLIPFDDLGVPLPIMRLLMEKELQGLVVVCGTYVAGKTTTASALTVARTRKFGGVSITVEDPPELPMEGPHGDGVCYQTWVNQGSFGQACRNAARWAPSIIFVGEVRDSEAASEAIRAAVSGTLVICTCHGESIPATVERLYTLAATGTANPEDVASVLSTALRAVLHQQLQTDRIGNKMLRCSFLKLDDVQDGRGKILKRDFKMLQDDVDRQLKRLVHGGSRVA